MSQTNTSSPGMGMGSSVYPTSGSGLTQAQMNSAQPMAFPSGVSTPGPQTAPAPGGTPIPQGAPAASGATGKGNMPPPSGIAPHPMPPTGAPQGSGMNTGMQFNVGNFLQSLFGQRPPLNGGIVPHGSVNPVTQTPSGAPAPTGTPGNPQAPATPPAAAPAWAPHPFTRGGPGQTDARLGITPPWMPRLAGPDMSRSAVYNPPFNTPGMAVGATGTPPVVPGQMPTVSAQQQALGFYANPNQANPTNVVY
jgi:hypothetical protein